MKIFRLKESEFLKGNINAIIAGNVIVCIALLVGIYIGYKHTSSRIIEDGISNTVSKLIPLGVFIIFMLLIIPRGIKLRKQKWLSYQLLVDFDGISKKEMNLTDISITRDEITEIDEFTDRGLQIKTLDKRKVIFIPKEIEEYEDVRGIVSKWKEIKVKPSSMNTQFLNIIICCVTIIAIAITFMSNNKHIVVPVGSILAIFLICCLIHIQKSRNIDTKIKKSSWIVLLPLVNIVLKIILLTIK